LGSRRDSDSNNKSQSPCKNLFITYALLFADNPPDETIAIPDFRTHPRGIIRKPSPELLETIRDAKLKQEWYRDYLLSEDAEPLILSEDTKIIRRYKTGRNLALAVISEVQANRMLYRDAFRILGVKSAESLREFSRKLGY